MRDRTVEARISELEQLIELWNRFYRMLESASKGATFSAEHEKDFLDIKSVVARRFQAVADKYEPKTFPDEDLTSVLTEAVSLEHASKMSGFGGEQLGNRWHRVYICLNKVLGHLESQREVLLAVNRLSYSFGRLLRNRFFIFVVILALIFGCGSITFKYYVNNLKPALEVLEKQEKEKEFQPEKEISPGDMQAAKLVRKLSIKARENGVLGKPVGIMRWFLAGSGALFAIILAAIAKSKKKSAAGWGFLGLLLGFIIFLVLRLLII